MSQHLRRDLPAADVASVQTSWSEAGRLERIRAGDEAAFEELFKGHYRGLCDFVHGYVGSPETAEELVQTVFLRVWEKHETWAPAVGARAYLFAASRNAAPVELASTHICTVRHHGAIRASTWRFPQSITSMRSRRRSC